MLVSPQMIKKKKIEKIYMKLKASQALDQEALPM